MTHQRCAVPGCVRFAHVYGVCAPHRLEEQLVAVFIGPCLPATPADPDDHILAALREEYENAWTDEDLERTKPLVIRSVDIRWQPEGGTPYGRAVLVGACRRIAGAEEGVRNNTLAREAFNVGGYCATGNIDCHYAARALLEAAKLVEMGEREACDVIARGMTAGARKPLEPPAA